MLSIVKIGIQSTRKNGVNLISLMR